MNLVCAVLTGSWAQQKLIHAVIYLCQNEGLCTKYPFALGMNGIWSPLLLKDISDNLVTYVELSDHEKEIIDFVKRSLYACNDIQVDILDWAEYLSWFRWMETSQKSAAFAINSVRNRFNPGDEILDKLKDIAMLERLVK